jgi:flagellar protein FliS
MIQKNAFAAYNNNKILTASPAELTLMLYDGAIKYANIAAAGIEQKDIEKAHVNLMKAQQIIRELQATLDHKYPVAEDFDAVYCYLLRRLREANMKKDSEIVEEVLRHLRTMRDAWKEVMRKTANGTRTTENVQVS